MLNGSTTIWQLTGENALGQPTAATTLSTSRTYSYSAAGLPTGRTSGSVYGETYTFDGTKGNLSNRTRTDQSSGQESFDYDSLNRLIEMGSRDVTYDAKGNITAIDDVGSLSYTDSSHPYRVTGATLDNGLSTPGTQTITYTAFDRPASISEGDITASFTYDESADRVKMAVTNGNNAILTRYYIGGNYEYDINSDNTVVQRLYLEGDAYSAPVVYIKNGSGNWTLYNIARDYQGSIMAIAASNGTAVASYSYDPWGRLRNPANNAIYTPGNEPSLMLGRGYTGHEHLPWFGLINMNARLYDPLVGRFLSADPYVQAPDFTQAFNRYSYALNNPLKYTDPSGEIVWFIPIIAAAVLGGTSGYMIGHSAGATGWNMAGYMVGGALIGGLSAGAAVGISALGGSAMTAGAAAGAIGGAGFNGLANKWNGKAMLQGTAFGTISGLIGSGIGSAIGGGWGALAGGATSNLTSQLLYNGGDFKKINWPSVGIGAGTSFAMYHGLSFSSWKWDGGNNLGGYIVNYSSYCKMNAQMQRSRFWHREFGGYLMDDGSYIKAKLKYSGKYNVDFDGVYTQLNSDQTSHVVSRVHTHWDTNGIKYFYNGQRVSAEEAYVYQQLGETITIEQTYLSFSPDDMSLPGNTMLLNRVGGGLYSNCGTSPNTTYFSDVFIRFFVFPYIP